MPEQAWMKLGRTLQIGHLGHPGHHNRSPTRGVTVVAGAELVAFVPATHTVVGWAASDLPAVVSYLAERDVVMEGYPGIDQDGDTLSLTQPARR
jgi:hypothetical protein